MPVLVAPDAFKGTLSAIEVAEAIGAGLRDLGLDADLCPLADGGEGTAATLLAARGGRRFAASAHDPLGRPIEAEFVLIDDGETAIVDVAAASGLTLVEPGSRDAEAASTYGTGELIGAAVAAGATHVVVAAGGSATTDGGVPERSRASPPPGGLRGARLTVLCDVRTPWESAAAVFGPQKGADAEAVGRLERRLEELAATLPRDPRGVPMTGCAGGLSGALWAQCGAELVPGAGWVMNAVDFDGRLARARAVVTGEGRLDSQSFEGKLPGEVVARAEAAGVAAYAFVGSVDPGDRSGLESRFAAVVEAGSPTALADAARTIDWP